MQCPKCAQALPETGQACPVCALRRIETVNAGLKGGTIGLALGLLGLSFFLGHDDLSLPLKVAVMLMPLLLFIAGGLFGYLKAKRERK